MSGLQPMSIDTLRSKTLKVAKQRIWTPTQSVTGLDHRCLHATAPQSAWEARPRERSEGNSASPDFGLRVCGQSRQRAPRAASRSCGPPCSWPRVTGHQASLSTQGTVQDCRRLRTCLEVGKMIDRCPCFSELSVVSDPPPSIMQCPTDREERIQHHHDR